MKIKSYSHIGFNVRDMEAMLDFYINVLGMKKKFVLTAKDMVTYSLQDTRELSDNARMHLEAAKQMGEKPFMVYLEMAPRQFVEFFYIYEPLKDQLPLQECYGYPHLCIEVEDLEEAYRDIVSKGVVPDTEMEYAPDYTRQFWVSDPEGNRIEIMEYTDKAFQLLGNWNP